jgi:arylsulfatase
MTIKKYPHFEQGTGAPYGGIENLRPETQEIVEIFESWH